MLSYVLYNMSPILYTILSKYVPVHPVDASDATAGDVTGRGTRYDPRVVAKDKTVESFNRP